MNISNDERKLKSNILCVAKDPGKRTTVVAAS